MTLLGVVKFSVPGSSVGRQDKHAIYLCNVNWSNNSLPKAIKPDKSADNVNVASLDPVSH